MHIHAHLVAGAQSTQGTTSAPNPKSHVSRARSHLPAAAGVQPAPHATVAPPSDRTQESAHALSTRIHKRTHESCSPSEASSDGLCQTESSSNPMLGRHTLPPRTILPRHTHTRTLPPPQLLQLGPARGQHKDPSPDLLPSCVRTDQHLVRAACLEANPGTQAL